MAIILIHAPRFLLLMTIGKWANLIQAIDTSDLRSGFWDRCSSAQSDGVAEDFYLFV